MSEYSPNLIVSDPRSSLMMNMFRWRVCTWRVCPLSEFAHLGSLFTYHEFVHFESFHFVFTWYVCPLDKCIHLASVSTCTDCRKRRPQACDDGTRNIPDPKAEASRLHKGSVGVAASYCVTVLRSGRDGSHNASCAHNHFNYISIVRVRLCSSTPRTERT
ncbi:hypothetical protein J6590_010139 [Homalodisca vitripennis]|nr:hypothetical protein J6590_010139 [Homalodisca vitripennis]